MDSIANDRSRWVDKWTFMHTNEGVRPFRVMDDLTFVGVPLFLAGIIAKSEKRAFRQNDGTEHVLVTSFHTNIDDYLQYFSPVLTVGLKVGGVEGRSDWGRFLAAAAMSYGFEVILVNSIKYTAKEQRPDGTSHNAWPSGHTATSFAGATILHKEYGLTRSPWYSVAGYGVATATAILRILNNRHWVSDILSGAGIGIMSTELGYALSDVFFEGKGLLRNNIDSIASIIQRPSFFAISMGVGIGSPRMHFPLDGLDCAGLNLSFRPSTMVSVESAYYINRYLGFGGRLRLNSAPIDGWNRMLDLAGHDPAHPLTYEIESDHLTEFAADLGVYANYPLSNRFAVGTKLLTGRSIMQELNLRAHDMQTVVLDDGTESVSDTSWDYFMLNANNTWHVGTGLSMTYAYKNNFAFRAFTEYDFTRKTYTLYYTPPTFMAGQQAQQHSLSKARHTLIFGASVAVDF